MYDPHSVTAKKYEKEVLYMLNGDTIKLLRECDAGTKMAVYSMDEICDKISDTDFKNVVTASRQKHERLGNEIHTQLEKCDDSAKEPNVFVKGMSWLKTNAKLAVEESDAVCADLLTEGCNMGVKSLCRYYNQYAAADEQAQGFCKELIHLEENLAKEIRSYL
jgi:hypothetical protein